MAHARRGCPWDRWKRDPLVPAGNDDRAMARTLAMLSSISCGKSGARARYANFWSVEGAAQFLEKRSLEMRWNRSSCSALTATGCTPGGVGKLE